MRSKALKKITVKLPEQNLRLDKFLTNSLKKTSRSYVKFLIDNDFVKVNGKIEKPSYLINASDLIEYNLPEKKQFLKTNLKLKVVYEDSDIIVYDKIAGLTMHPNDSEKPRNEVTLVDLFRRDYSKAFLGHNDRPGIVHRLDKNTSGLIVLAKNQQALDSLQGQFKHRKVYKEYLALIWGRLVPKEGQIEAPIARSKTSGQKFVVSVSKTAREAKTDYQVLAYYKYNKEFLSYVLVKPKTGRTHQIRVHFACLGHPVVGDSLYGRKNDFLLEGRHFLHASFLRLENNSDHVLELKSQLPKELLFLLNNLEIVS